MYKATELAKYIVTKCTNEDQPITNLQLQKILYYIQKEFLKQARLAFVDDIEAWQFGPAVPNLYYMFGGFGAMPITVSYKDISVELADKKLIDSIIESKRILNPWEISEEIQKQGSAWYQTYKNGKGNHQVIPKDFISKEVIT